MKELNFEEIESVSGAGYVCTCYRDGRDYNPAVTRGFLWTGSANECKGYCCDDGGAQRWRHIGFGGSTTSGVC